MKRSIVYLSVLFASVSFFDAEASNVELNAWPVEPSWPMELMAAPYWPLDAELYAWPVDSESEAWPEGEKLSYWPE